LKENKKRFVFRSLL